ncbi:hypothetical protein Tco_1419329 [Tanacetum coccineum]
MEKTQRKPKELLPYGMFLTRLFKHVVSVFPELEIDRYISHDQVMHPLAPHYERKTRSDRGMKRPRESNARSSSTTLNHPSSSHQLDDTLDENDDESFHSNSSSPSQNISSSSNVVSRVHQNSPHETKPSLASSSIHTMLCYVILPFPLFKSSNSHTSLPPSSSSSYSPSSSMSCSNHQSNFSRKQRMSVRQVWKHKTSTPKSSHPSQNDSPPLPPRIYLQSPSPPSYNPLKDQMINQLHNMSTILDSHTNPSNAYIHAPPSPPPQQMHSPSHA